MKFLVTSSLCALLFLIAPDSSAIAQDGEQVEVEFMMTPSVQKELDVWKKTAAKWVADPNVIAAVQEANKTGPISDMSKDAWKKLAKDSRSVAALRMNPTAKLFVAKMKATQSPSRKKPQAISTRASASRSVSWYSGSTSRTSRKCRGLASPSRAAFRID